MASVNEKHFKAGGGHAAVKKLLAAQAAAARQLTGATQSGQQTAKPTEAQLARLRARVAANGKRELERQQKESNRQEASETTYSGNKVYRNGKHIGNMVNGKLVKLGSDKPTGTNRNWRNGYGAQSDKPSSGDPSTWRRKPEPEKKPEPDKKPPSSITGNNNGGSSSGSSGSSGGSSSSSSSSSSSPRRKPTTAPPPVSKGVVEKTADRYKAKTKKVKERKTYLQTKEGGGLSKRMAAALADKDALKFNPDKKKK